MDSDTYDVPRSHVFRIERRNGFIDDYRVANELSWRCTGDDKEPPGSDDTVADSRVCRIYQYDLAHQNIFLFNCARAPVQPVVGLCQIRQIEIT